MQLRRRRAQDTRHKYTASELAAIAERLGPDEDIDSAFHDESAGHRFVNLDPSQLPPIR